MICLDAASFIRYVYSRWILQYALFGFPGFKIGWYSFLIIGLFALFQKTSQFVIIKKRADRSPLFAFIILVEAIMFSVYAGSAPSPTTLSSKYCLEEMCEKTTSTIFMEKLITFFVSQRSNLYPSLDPSDFCCDCDSYDPILRREV